MHSLFCLSILNDPGSKCKFPGDFFGNIFEIKVKTLFLL